MAATDAKTTSYPEIMSRLRVIMAKRKWSQAKLARKLNRDHGQISRWFNPEHEMKISSLLSICKVMEISPDLLFRESA